MKSWSRQHFPIHDKDNPYLILAFDVCPALDEQLCDTYISSEDSEV